MNKAKLLTGEIVNFKASSVEENAFYDLQYVGKGYYLNDDTKKYLHFWVEKKKYTISDINIGDKFLTYISSTGSMGAGVYGKKENLVWIIFGGIIENTSAYHAYYQNGNPVAIPIHDNDILYIEEGNTGDDIMRSIMLRNALSLGGSFISNYIERYNEIPFLKGTKIKPTYNYYLHNKALGLRNNHKIMNSLNLTFDSWNIGDKFITVKSNNKTALLAINSIEKV